MSVIFCADLHFGADRLNSIASAWMQLHQYAAEHCITTVVVAGDMHDDGRLALGHDATAGDIQHAVLAPKEEYPDMNWVILKGNHDEEGPHHRSALEYLTAVPRTIVVEKPRLIRLPGEGMVLACVPWAWNSYLTCNPEIRALSRADFLQRAAELREMVVDGMAAEWHGERGIKVLTGHAEIGGAVNRYRPLPPGQFHVFNMETLVRSGADHLAFGHYHKQQSIGGVPVYIGALIQHNAGEEGNPTGFTVIHENGSREWVEVTCPRFYTVQSMDELEAIPLQPGDDVKLRALERPASLPEGVRFDKLLIPHQNASRASGITVDSDPQELCAEWHRVTPNWHGVNVNFLLEALRGLLAECPLPPVGALLGGRLDYVRQIVIRGIGTHRNTVIDIPENLDGPIAFFGEVGSGKSTALETVYAVFFGAYLTYPGPLYDMIQEDYDGIPCAEVLFGAMGRMFRAIKRFHIKGKSRSTESLLNEVINGVETPMTTGKRGNYQDEIMTVLGDAETMKSTVFQSQKDHGNIVDAEPRDRMRLMRTWLGADRFADLHEKAKGALAVLVANISTVTARLAATEDTDTLLEAALALMVKHRDDAAAAEASIAALTERGQKLVAEKAALEATIKQATEASDAWRLEREKAASEYRSLKQDRQALTKRIENLEADLAQEGMLREGAAKLADAEASLEVLNAYQASRTAAAAKGNELREHLAMAKLALSTVEGSHNSDVISERLVRERKMAPLKDQIAAARRTLNEKLSAAKINLTMLTAKGAMLEKAGCKENPIPHCSFIADAIKAPARIAELTEEIEGLELTQAMESYAADARAALEALEAEVDPPRPAKLADLELEVKRLKMEVAALPLPPKDRESERPALLSFIQAARHYGERLASMAGYGVALQTMREQRDAIDANIKAKEEFVAGKDPGENLPTHHASLTLLVQDITQAREEVREFQKAARTAVELLGSASTQVDHLRTAQEGRKKDVEHLEALKSRKPVAECLAAFLHPTGVPQLIIDVLTPRLNEIVAQIMAEIQDDEFVITFRTQREQKNEKLEEGFFIDVEDAWGVRDITRHSGGEFNRLKRAVRLTLGWWQMERRGFHHRVYFLDEPTMGIGSQLWISRFMNAIFRLSERFQQVFIVSHEPQVLQSCPAAFRFERLPKQMSNVFLETLEKSEI